MAVDEGTHAWILYERDRIEGIALTWAAKAAFMREWVPEGVSRSAIPHPVFAPVAKDGGGTEGSPNVPAAETNS